MRIGRLIIYAIVYFAVSFAVIHYDLVSYDYFVKPEFLFTFLGVFIGFALTLYTYITSMFEKMTDIIKEKYKKQPEEIKNRLTQLPKLHTEIKDNIMYLFYVLLIVVVVSIGDKQLLKLNQSFEVVKHTVDAILMTIFLLSITALKDLIVTSFAISDYIIKSNNEQEK